MRDHLTPEELRQRKYARMDGTPAACFSETVLALHPFAHPDNLPPFPGFLFDGTAPRSDSTTAEWLTYRAECAALASTVPHAAALLAQADYVLAWRAAFPEALRFWNDDDGDSGFSLVLQDGGNVIGGKWVPGSDEAEARDLAADLADDSGLLVRVYRNGVEIGTVDGARPKPAATVLHIKLARPRP